MRIPHSSLVVKSIGPSMRSRPRARSHPVAASTSARAVSGSFSDSKNPNIPSLPPWNCVHRSSTWAVMRPTGAPSRSARKYSASACSKKGFLSRSRNCLRSMISGGTQGESRWRRNGTRMNSLRSRFPSTGRTVTRMGPDAIRSDGPTMSWRPPPWETLRMPETIRAPVDVFERARTHERKEQLEAAKEANLLPYFRLIESQAGPVVEMEGRETIMLGSNNYLGLTGDERVKAAARDALDRYGTALTGSRFMNGTIPLHVELEREIAAWMGTEDALVFTTGYQVNLGTIGTLLGPGDTVICDSGDHASILDGCRLSGAKLRPFRHNQMDKL